MPWTPGQDPFEAARRLFSRTELKRIEVRAARIWIRGGGLVQRGLVGAALALKPRPS